MCDDIEATVRELKAKGVEFSGDVTRQRSGLITAIQLPSGGQLGSTSRCTRARCSPRAEPFAQPWGPLRPRPGCACGMLR